MSDIEPISLSELAEILQEDTQEEGFERYCEIVEDA